MFLVRKETRRPERLRGGRPARIAQFVSSGMKNIKGDILKLGRLLGFAFPLSDLTPAERLIWDDNTPAPVKAAAGVRFAAAVRDRLGQRAGARCRAAAGRRARRSSSRPDATWRADARAGRARPTASAPSFARPGRCPNFDPHDVDGTYAARSRRRHAALARQVPLRPRRAVRRPTSASSASSSTGRTRRRLPGPVHELARQARGRAASTPTASSSSASATSARSSPSSTRRRTAEAWRSLCNYIVRDRARGRPRDRGPARRHRRRHARPARARGRPRPAARARSTARR